MSLPRYIIIPNTSSRHDPAIGATTSDIVITPVHSFNNDPIDKHQNVLQFLLNIDKDIFLLPSFRFVIFFSKGMIFEEDRPQLKEIHGSRECFEHGKRLCQPQRALGAAGLDLPCEQLVPGFSECRNKLFPSLSTNGRTTRCRDSNTEQPQFSAANRAA